MYFIEAILGLCYLRVPTSAPFKLQFYCNGHGWLAHKLTAKRIGFTLADNAFLNIDDFAAAQRLANSLRPRELHRAMVRYAKMCCPVQDTFGQRYHWSFLSTLDDHSAGARALDRLTETQRDEDRPVEGLNFFERTEQALLRCPAAS